ncbi:MAG TPA: hypothetical protein VI757_02760 [Bacteroidia bacterium]|nr:hypothetical protein [Bacteroidia bacterium]
MTSFEMQEVIHETNSVMKIFFEQFTSMFLTPGKSCYSLDIINGNDPSKLKKLTKKNGNCYIRSLIQCLYWLGYTIEIKIVPRKMRSASGAMQTVS